MHPSPRPICTPIYPAQEKEKEKLKTEKRTYFHRYT